MGLACVMSRLVYVDCSRAGFPESPVVIPRCISLGRRMVTLTDESHFLSFEGCGPWRFEEKKSFWKCSWTRKRKVPSGEDEWQVD